MPLSVAGAQLPITAFLNTQTAQQPKRKPSEPRLAVRRKDSARPERIEHDAGPSRKRKRQKENPSVPRSSAHKSKDGHGAVSHSLQDAAEGDLVLDLTQDDDLEELRPHKNGSVVASHSLPTFGSTSARASDQPPLTPVAHGRSPRLLAAASLPSPPLTAPTSKRVRRLRRNSSEERRRSNVDVPAGHHVDRAPPPHTNDTFDDITAQIVGNKDAIVLRSPERVSGAAMPPPPLPPKASSSMPTRPQLRPPRTSSPDRWVPSSQTQELSIPPSQSQSHSTVPHTPAEQMTQVVPSSQSHERELRMSDDFLRTSDVHKAPVSPLKRGSSPVSPLIPGSEDSHLLPGEPVACPSSPHFVQSSQSQSEHDLSAAWAKMLSTRHASLSREKQDGSIDLPSSSPPRLTESQDYDAQDEYSQSQDAYSQPSTFASPDSRTSPLPIASQYTDASSASSLPCPSMPTQLREFVGMFDNRDEFGNELSTGEDGPSQGTGRSRSVSPSQVYGRMASMDDIRAGSSSGSHAYGTPRSGQHDAGLAGGQDLLDIAMESQQSQSQSQSYAGSSEDVSASSFPEELPTQVREFIGMFDRSQASQV